MGRGDDFEAIELQRVLELSTTQMDQIDSSVVTISTKRPAPETTYVNKAKKRRSEKKSHETPF